MEEGDCAESKLVNGENPVKPDAPRLRSWWFWLFAGGFAVMEFADDGGSRLLRGVWLFDLLGVIEDASSQMLLRSSVVNWKFPWGL